MSMSNVLATNGMGLSNFSQGRKTSPIDMELGRRIRQERLARSMSQEALASRIAISCQQLQKYEVGRNRISVARLVGISEALEVGVTVLLSGDRAPKLQPKPAPGTSVQEMLELMTVFGRIENNCSRAKIVELARFLADLEDDARSISR